MNIVIDPNMFCLTKEDDIKENIVFFEYLVHLCSLGRFNIFVYKDLLGKILQRQVKPFPLFYGNIKDPNLVQIVKRLNDSFTAVVMKRMKPYDIDTCDGEQQFEITSTPDNLKKILLEQDEYYGMLFVLLRECYCKNLKILGDILTGVVGNGRKYGDSFCIQCTCDKLFTKEYFFNEIEKYVDEKDKAYFELEKLASKIEFIVSPEMTHSQHHNHLQYNNADFNSYEDLSSINKAAISILRKFGLNKVIFGRFYNNDTGKQGTIDVNDIQQTENGDILSGWLHAETGYKYHVNLFFPSEVGRCLSIYLNNKFEKKEIERLVDRIL